MSHQKKKSTYCVSLAEILRKNRNVFTSSLTVSILTKEVAATYRKKNPRNAFSRSLVLARFIFSIEQRLFKRRLATENNDSRKVLFDDQQST
jgi:hypothetical protein